MNSPDESIFRFQKPQPRASAKPLGNSPFVIMYHGSLVERNGLELAVDALPRVRKNVPEVELRVYGAKTPFLQRVLNKAQQLGLQETVHYLGPRRLEDLVREIGECDIGIVPNQRNAFTDINTPTRIFEYLALGKPVIAPSTPGIQDYFAPGSLFFFESGNADDLARAIEHAYSHSGLAFETAVRGQEIYLAHTWREERQTLINLVRGLIAS